MGPRVIHHLAATLTRQSRLAKITQGNVITCPRFKATYSREEYNAPMKSYATIQAALAKLESYDLKPGDWVWLKADDNEPRRKAQLRGPLAAVTLVTVASENATDDGLRLITADNIECKAV